MSFLASTLFWMRTGDRGYSRWIYRPLYSLPRLLTPRSRGPSLKTSLI